MKNVQVFLLLIIVRLLQMLAFRIEVIHLLPNIFGLAISGLLAVFVAE